MPSVKEVISTEYGWNTIARAKIVDGVKIHTSCKILKFCQHFSDTKTQMGFCLKRQSYIDIQGLF